MASDRTIYVIDDDDALRDSLTFLLASAGLQTRAFESAAAFLQNLPATPAGCVITDVRMSGISGLEMMKRLRDKGFAMPIIVMTGHADIPLAVEAMRLGAHDFIEKPFDDEVMLASVNSALGKLRDSARASADQVLIRERLSLLSGRELQVLEGVVAGKANKVIAFDLGISPRTVEVYRANVMGKMEARSLSDLVRMALTTDVLAGKS